MVKRFLTYGIFICMVCPVFADTTPTIPVDVSTTPPTVQNNDCDTSVLGTDTGPVKLKANWEANTIDIQWKKNDGTNDTVSGGSTDCTYDGSVTLPPNPTRLGYTFNGWKVENTNS